MEAQKSLFSGYHSKVRKWGKNARKTPKNAPKSTFRATVQNLLKITKNVNFPILPKEKLTKKCNSCIFPWKIICKSCIFCPNYALIVRVNRFLFQFWVDIFTSKNSFFPRDYKGLRLSVKCKLNLIFVIKCNRLSAK